MIYENLNLKKFTLIAITYTELVIKSSKEQRHDTNQGFKKFTTMSVKDFNLDIEDNEFVVFVGPSGWEINNVTYDCRT